MLTTCQHYPGSGSATRHPGSVRAVRPEPSGSGCGRQAGDAPSSDGAALGRSPHGLRTPGARPNPPSGTQCGAEGRGQSRRSAREPAKRNPADLGEWSAGAPAHSISGLRPGSDASGWLPFAGLDRSPGGPWRELSDAYACGLDGCGSSARETRSRPAFLARYNAESAAASSPSSDSPSRHLLTPKLTVIDSLPTRVSIALSATAARRRSKSRPT